MLACKGISARPSIKYIVRRYASHGRRYAADTMSHDKFMGILYHEAKMLACKRHFLLCRQLPAPARSAHNAAKPPDFAQGKIPSILNHEAKMLACKGILRDRHRIMRRYASHGRRHAADTCLTASIM